MNPQYPQQPQYPQYQPQYSQYPQYPQYPYPPPRPHRPKLLTDWTKVCLLITMGVLYFAALFLPVFGEDRYNYNGLCALIGGVLTILANVFMFTAWFANLPFFIALIIYIASSNESALRLARIIAFVALCFSLAILLVTSLPDDQKFSVAKTCVPVLG